MCFESIKKDCENFKNEYVFKFQWINYFLDYLSKNPKLSMNCSVEYIKYFISIYGLNFKKYIEFLIK